MFSHPTLLAAIHKACPELMELRYLCDFINEKGEEDVIYHVTQNAPFWFEARTERSLGKYLDFSKTGQFEILGHEPQLAHVLRTIEKTKNWPPIAITSHGLFLKKKEISASAPYIVTGATWNLILGLYAQDTATLDFLEQLLVSK